MYATIQNITPLRHLMSCGFALDDSLRQVLSIGSDLGCYIFSL